MHCNNFISLVDVIENVKNEEHKGIIFITSRQHEKFVSYKGIYISAKRILYNLQQEGVKAGNEIVFQLEDNEAFICVFWACILGGFRAVTLLSAVNEEEFLKLFHVWKCMEHGYVVADENSSAKLTAYVLEHETDGIQQIKERTLMYDSILDTKSEGKIHDVKEDDIAMIQFSSGSTGSSKGVILTHHNLLVNIKAMISQFQINENDSCLSWVPLSHDLGLIGMHIVPLAFNLFQYNMKTSLFLEYPVIWFDKVNKHRITIIASPNFGYQYIMKFLSMEEEKEWDLSCVNKIFNGAELVSMEVCHKFLTYMKKYKLNYHSMLPVYGLAEAVLGVSCPPVGKRIKCYHIKRERILIGEAVCEANPQEEGGISVVDLGYPIQGCDVKIFHNNQELPEKYIGNIKIKGENVTSGYYKNEEATKAVFDKYDWLDTGDIGFLNEGRLVIVGREKEMIIIKGKNFFPTDLERVVHESIGTAMGEVAACNIYDEQEGTEKVNIFILNNGDLESFSKKASIVKKQINSKIGIVAECIVPVSVIPKTVSGKVQRLKLGQLYQGGTFNEILRKLDQIADNQHEDMEFVKPEGELEIRICEIWKELFERDSISVCSQFFEIGGESLKAALLINRLKEAFQVDISLEQIFKTPTIRGLAEYINEDKNKKKYKIKQAGMRRYYPLTGSQKRIYVHQMNSNSTIYNLPQAFLMEGKPNLERFEQAFVKLINRHEVLRTSIEFIEDEFMQKIHPAVDFQVEEYELGNNSIDEKIHSFIRPFDLSKAPLLRVGFIKIREEYYLMLFDIHHIISDGTSLLSLVKEFVAYYKGQELQELPIKFKDFAVWQQEFMKTEAYKIQENYWLEKLSGELPILNMPLDYARPAIQNFRGDSIIREIDEELTFQLNCVARNKGCTLYMVLLAAFNILLAKYCSQEDIIVGSPILGRNQGELQHAMGLFINILAMRNKPMMQKSFATFLEEVRKNVIDGYDNQDYQYEDLVEHVLSNRDVGRNPLFDVFFTFQNMEVEDVSLDDVLLQNYKVSSKVSKFDFSIYASEKENKIKLEAEYSIDLFKRQTMERLLEHFIKILKEISSNPQILILNINLLEEKERYKLFHEFNDTYTKYEKEKVIHQLIEEQVKKTPDKVAVVFGNQEITYEQLNNQANKIAVMLKNRGVQRDNIVGIMLDRSIEILVCILGILKSGGAYLPIDPEFPPKRIKYMLDDSMTQLLLTSHSYQSQVEFEGEKIFVEDIKTVAMEENLPIINTPKDLAYVIYTSGSTGNPKGVMIEHQSVVNFIKGMSEKIPFVSDKRILALTTISFDIFVLETLLPLVNGMCIIMAGKEQQIDPYMLGSLIKTKKIDMVQTTPSRLFLLFGEQEEQACDYLGGVKEILVGGEEFPFGLLNKLKCVKNLKIYNVYGPTETTVWSSFKEVTNSSFITIGKPIANTRIYIMDNYQRQQPIGVYGEIYIGGDGLSRGYFNRTQLTKEKFIPDPYDEGQLIYRTGDLGRWLENGEVEFVGRADYQVKIRGYRIELGEIESRLMKHKYVREAIVKDYEDTSKNKYLCAYLIVKKNIDTKSMKQFLSDELPNYMIPSYFIILEKFPLTPNGKIDKSKLPLPDMDNEEEGYVEPQSDIEVKLARIWKKILELNKVSITDNFFEIGGHSLRTAILVSNIKKDFLVDLTVSCIFKKPTIKELAMQIQNSKQYKEEPLVHSEKKSFYPVSPAQNRLYVLHLMESASTNYNMPIALSVTGSLEQERVNYVFKTIMRRHEALRTSFEQVENQIVQHIHDTVDLDIDFINAAEDQVQKQAADFIQPFDLSKAPLLRVKVLKISNSRYVLLFDMHHIISDGESLRIIIHEFSRLYAGKELQEIEWQYRDFSEWQNSYIESGKIEKQKQFWFNTLSKNLPVLNLPLDYTRPNAQSFEGNRLLFEIGEKETAALKQLANKENVTLFMVLFAAYNVLLHKYSGQEDIVVGTPIGGRNYSYFENTIGIFVNTVVLRTFPTGSKSFEQYLSEVRDCVLGAFENQDYQFENLIQLLNIEKDVARNPLFDVMFVMQNTNANQIEIDGLSFSILDNENKISKFDITLNAIETENKISFDLEYCSKLFHEKSILRMAGHYQNILKEIIKGYSNDINSIDIMGQEEMNQIIYQFNETEILKSSKKGIHELFEEQAEFRCNEIALIFQDKTMTYGELNKKANKIAWMLKQKGIGENSVVGIMFGRSFEMIIGIMGILKAGAVYLPIDTDYPTERINYLLDHSEIEVLLISENIKDKLRAADRIQCIDMDESLRDEQLPEYNLNLSFNIKRLIYILYTSGSTGQPKGVKVRADGFVNLVNWYMKEFCMNESDTNLLVAPISFDLAQKNLFASLLSGGRLCLFRSGIFDYYELSNTIHREHITIINCAPSAFYPLIDFNEMSCFEKLSSLKYIILGGEPINLTILRRWFQLPNCHAELVNTYGPTECTDIATFYRVKKAEIECDVTVSIGKSIPNVKVFIFDKNKKPVPINVTGEICIGGIGLSEGYNNLYELTKEKFVNSKLGTIYKTGDLAKWLPDGNIEYIGRSDDQVKIRGRRIELGEILHHLTKYKGVKEGAVTVMDDPMKNKFICAYYTADKLIDETLFRQSLGNQLPEFMVPDFFLRVEQMPLSPNGKINIKALPAPDFDERKHSKMTEPCNEMERELMSIWGEIIGTESIDVNKTLFEMGGHSINLVFFISKIARRFQVEVPIMEIFKAPTIRSLAKYIAISKKDIYGDMEPLAHCEYYPVSAAQKRLYIQHKIDKNNVNYNMSAIKLIEGDFDVKRFEHTLRNLLSRHEILRTSFEMRGGVPVQIIHKTAEINLQYNKDSDANHEKMIAEFFQPFDLAKAPLIRVGLIALDENKHILIFDMHHIISDGFSMNILMKEFCMIYNSEKLPSLRIQYKDYAHWHNKLLESKQMKEQEDYWLEKLNHFEYTQLPKKNYTFDIQEEGEVIQFIMNKQTNKKISEYCKVKNVTKFVCLLSVFYTVLHHITGNEDLSIGIPVAGRNNHELESMLGVFLNVLVIRNSVQCEQTFDSLISSVNKTVFEALSNQDYPYDRLYTEVKKRCQLKQSSLFGILFNYTPIEPNELIMKGIIVKDYGKEKIEPKYDLTIYVNEYQGELIFKLVFPKGLFFQDTLDGIVSEIKTISNKVIENSEVKLKELYENSKLQISDLDSYFEEDFY